jgi:acyl dehydratase
MGDRFVHAGGRTITDHDNTWLSLLTHNQNPIHIDHAASARSHHGRPLVESIVTLGICVGLSNPDLLGSSDRDVEYRQIRHLAPVFSGDTLRATSEVVAVDPPGRQATGRVTVRTVGRNQHDDPVIEFQRVLSIFPRPPSD